MSIYLNIEFLSLLFLFGLSYVIGIQPAKDMMMKCFLQFHDEIESNRLKILSWNVAKNKNLSWMTEFTKIFHNYEPDIFILQEVKLEKKLKNVLLDKLLVWRFSPNIINLKRQLYSGVLTASSVQPATETFSKSTSKEPIFATPKATIFTTYKIAYSNERLLVVNIHGINFVSLKKFRAQIHEVIEYGHNHVGPIIFSGDFNTWNKNRIIFLVKILKRKLNLVPVDFDKSNKKHIKKFILSPPLDHIFYTPDKLKLVKNSERVIRECKSSDHKPIFAEFELMVDREYISNSGKAEA
ncbi:MAG: endonuclease/exonuclease/phosphatase family protein [Candidatus Marinimicrobia bacterium]|nr:endonuclease/exonuclease/phosphatase family protein [Candidatus Neomarinimicrobiota bacterium]